MTRTHLSTFLAAAAALTLAFGPGCVGTAPENGGTGADGGSGTGADAGEGDPQAINVTGMVMDYFAGDPLAEAIVETDGITPLMSATALTDGSYTLANVPAGSTFFASARFAANYRPTRSEPITVAASALVANIYVVSQADEGRQYASVGVTRIADTSLVIVDLRRNNGSPLEGLAADAMVLEDLAQAPMGEGPYFFGAGGDIRTIAQEPSSKTYTGKARAAFLNVPAGVYNLKVTYLGGDGTPMTITTPITTVANGATLALSGAAGGGSGGGGGGGGEGPGPGATLSFRNDVYPILQKASKGGDACANCHTEGGLAGGVLQFDLPVEEVYAAVTDPLRGIVVLTPAADIPLSTLLSKPLYETPPNHPNATYLTMDAPSYLIMMTWIQQGAPLEAAGGGGGSGDAGAGTPDAGL